MLANSNELKLILPKLACPLYFFSTSLNKQHILLEENCQYCCSLVCNFFAAKHYRSRWEYLDCFRYQLQPIKLENLVVLSPCETQPYNYLIWENQMANVCEMSRASTGVSRTIMSMKSSTSVTFQL